MEKMVQKSTKAHGLAGQYQLRIKCTYITYIVANMLTIIARPLWLNSKV